MWLRFLVVSNFLLFLVAELSAATIYRPFYTLREKGQGGAITAASTDFSAVMFNPANMAELTEGHTNMGFGGSFTPAFFDFQRDFADFVGEQDELQKAIQFNNIVNTYSGEVFALNPYLYGMHSGTKWGYALVPMNLDMNIAVSSDSFSINSIFDAMLLFGTGRKINERWAWGTTFKTVYRGFFNLDVTATDLLNVNNDSLFDNSAALFGATFDFDLATNYRFKTWRGIESKVSVVARNLFDQGFRYAKRGVGDAPKLQRSLDIGSHFQFKRFWVFTPALMFDIRSIGVQEWDFVMGSHLGAELQWQAYSWLKGAYRLGLNQGYFTAGLNMQMAWFRLDLVSWGEEVGTKSARRESRRVALNMSLDF